jgi:hypothetical protein
MQTILHPGFLECTQFRVLVLTALYPNLYVKSCILMYIILYLVPDLYRKTHYNYIVMYTNTHTCILVYIHSHVLRQFSVFICLCLILIDLEVSYLYFLIALKKSHLVGENYYLVVLWRAFNHTAFKHSSTSPVVHLFASSHEGSRFNPQVGTYVKPGFLLELSCYIGDTNMIDHFGLV